MGGKSMATQIPGHFHQPQQTLQCFTQKEVGQIMKKWSQREPDDSTSPNTDLVHYRKAFLMADINAL